MCRCPCVFPGPPSASYGHEDASLTVNVRDLHFCHSAIKFYFPYRGCVISKTAVHLFMMCCDERIKDVPQENRT